MMVPKGADKKTYASWCTMKARCYNPNNNRYYRYGGRGIKVCDRWRESYANFVADMGVRPAGMTLDRKDTDKDYCPGNCKWSSNQEQMENMSRCKSVTIEGVEYPTISAACRAYSVPLTSVYSRMGRGLTLEQALGVK